MEKVMYSAKQAHFEACEVLEQRKQFDEVFKDIKKAAKQGRFELRFDLSIVDWRERSTTFNQLQATLESKGYAVERVKVDEMSGRERKDYALVKW
jgi:hypothetical protein